MKLSLLVLAFIPAAASADALDLRFDDIPKIVRENNQLARSSELLAQAAGTQRGHLRRSYLPQVSAGVGSENFRTGTQFSRTEPYGTLDAQVNLYRGGRDAIEDEVAGARVQAAGAEQERVLRQEIRKARSSYWRLVADREIARILEEAIEENKRNLKAAEARIRAGQATATDRIEFEMHRIELEQDLARLRLAAQNAERDLVAELGVTSGTQIKTPDEVGHDHTDDLLKTAYQASDNPGVRSLSARSLELGLKSKQTARWWTPSVDVYGRYGLFTYAEREYEPMSERFESAVGIHFKMNLFDGLSGRANRNQAALEAASAQFEVRQAERELSAQIEGARQELLLTHDLIHQSEDALRQAKSYLGRTLDEYRRGVKNSVDVLSASERNSSMRRRFAELRRDYQLARAQLLENFGR